MSAWQITANFSVEEQIRSTDQQFNTRINKHIANIPI